MKRIFGFICSVGVLFGGVDGAVAALETVEFTAEEGYSNGANLGPGSSAWYGQGSGQNVLDTTGSGSVTLDPDSPDCRAVYKTGYTSGSGLWTVAVDFECLETAASGAGDVMTLLVSKKNAVAIDMFASLQRSGSSYQFYMTNVGGTPLTSPAFSAADLGFDGSLNDVSDKLSFSLSLEKGSNETDWTLTMALYNQTQSTDVYTYTASNVVTSVAFYNNAKLFGGFSSADAEASTGTGSRIVERFSIGLGEPDPGGGGNPGGEPDKTGWELFVETFSLSGDPQADSDGDGQKDIVEFAHGGNPTNPADLALLPATVMSTNGMVFQSLETTNANPGIPYISEWTDNLATGEWSRVFDGQQVQPSAVAGYNQAEFKVNGDYSQLYFRTRLSHLSGRPNILFIVADDLGYADVSFNNSHPQGPDLLTPQLDNLATNGMIFSSAYVVHPFCGPSRMGLMSGRYPHEFGAPYNLPDSNTGLWVDQGIPESETMFSKVLQDAGYFTGIMGKWHLGQQPQHHPNARGFDEFWGFLGGGKYYDPAELKPQGPSGAIVDYKTWPEHNGVEVEPTDWMTDWLTEKGADFIHAAATNSEPFFLFMSYNAPHTPLDYKPSDYAAVTALLRNPVVEQRKKYLALVYALDRGVGNLVQALKDSGQYENTLIVFISDNGGRQNFGSSNHPLRGWKDDVLEGGVRVPMFMHWPGVIPSNTVYDHPVTALDFYPTFARLGDALIPGDKDLDGVDIWNAVLAGESPRPGQPVYTVRYQAGYSTTGFTHVGIRQDNWKAVRWYSDWKLFDFSLPGHKSEQDVYDLSSVYPEVLSNLVSEAEIWSADHVRPLWFDSLEQETFWDARSMPQYDQVFDWP